MFKKITILSMCAILNVSSFATDEKVIDMPKKIDESNEILVVGEKTTPVNESTKSIIKSDLTDAEVKRLVLKERQRKCFKESYHVVKDFEEMLVLSEDRDSEVLFEKIKKTSIWSKLDLKEKEMLAESVIRWTISGDEKILEVRQLIANYYIEECNKIK